MSSVGAGRRVKVEVDELGSRCAARVLDPGPWRRQTPTLGAENTGKSVDSEASPERLLAGGCRAADRTELANHSVFQWSDSRFRRCPKTAFPAPETKARQALGRLPSRVPSRSHRNRGFDGNSAGLGRPVEGRSRWKLDGNWMGKPFDEPRWEIPSSISSYSLGTPHIVSRSFCFGLE